MKSTKSVFSFVDGEHYDSSLENAIIGACLLETFAFAEVHALLEADFFFLEINRIIFSALKQMFESGQSIDLITTAHHLRKQGVIMYKDYSIPYILTKIAQNVVTSAHIVPHSLILREMFMERELLAISMRKYEGDAIDRADAIQEAISKAMTIKGVDDWRNIGDVMVSLDKHRHNVRNKELMGVPTSFPSLDLISGGFQPGQMVIVAARPSVGKTAFIGGIAVNAAKTGYKVGVVSLEMPEEQIGARLASIYSDIEFYKIYRSMTQSVEEENRLIDSMHNMAHLPLFITDKTNVTAAAIRAKAEKLKKRKGLDLLIIDYLQLIETESKNNENREREVAKLSRAMKLLALELKIPIIVLCQLNRQSETKGSPVIPRMSQIRESGSLEQDADVVILLHRDWKSGKLQDENGNSTERQADIIVEKNRNGETKRINVSFDPDLMKFYEESQTTFKPLPKYEDDEPF